MADIKLLIKISNKTYEAIQSGDYCGIINAEVYNAIKNGVPQVTETITEFADRCRECGKRYTKRQTGHWIRNHFGFECNNCHNSIEGKWDDNIDDITGTLFCPSCGARMRKESEG